VPELSTNFEENLSFALEKSGEQNKVLGSYKIIIDYFIIFTIWLHYCMYIKFSSRNAIRKKCGSKWGCCYFLFEKKILNPSVQYHVFDQSPPGQGSNGKYPVNTSHSTRFE
jgi:hypothetical protein